jgi:hypothetical protein
MLELKPQQCVIVTDEVLMEFQRKDAKVWLDNVYARMQRTPQNKGSRARLISFNTVSAWLTNVTIQGDGGFTEALYPFTFARVLMQGVTLRHHCQHDNGVCLLLTAHAYARTSVVRHMQRVKSALDSLPPSAHSLCPPPGGCMHSSAAHPQRICCCAAQKPLHPAVALLSYAYACMQRV